jgi:hypothetical protein
LIGAAGYLAYDDYYKQRPALEEAQKKVQQLTAEANQLRQNPVRLNVGAPTAPAAPLPPTWFQKRLEDGSSLELSRQHRHQDENSTGRP